MLQWPLLDVCVCICVCKLLVNGLTTAMLCSFSRIKKKIDIFVKY